MHEQHAPAVTDCEGLCGPWASHVRGAVNDSSHRHLSSAASARCVYRLLNTCTAPARRAYVWHTPLARCASMQGNARLDWPVGWELSMLMLRISCWQSMPSTAPMQHAGDIYKLPTSLLILSLQQSQLPQSQHQGVQQQEPQPQASHP